MLKIQQVSFSYHKDKEVLKDISFQLKSRTITGILGPNGTGKTTLLKCINRILLPSSGAVFLADENLSQMSLLEIAQKVAYVPQYTTGNASSTVLECVLMGRFPYANRQYTSTDRELAFQMIEKLGLKEKTLTPLREISGGERQRAFIARALVQRPQMILLDEPTNNLDLKNQLLVLQILEDLVKEDDVTIVLTLHDLNLAALFCDRVILLDQARIYIDGHPNEVINEETIQQVYQVKTFVDEEKEYKYVRLLK